MSTDNETKEVDKRITEKQKKEIEQNELDEKLLNEAEKAELKKLAQQEKLAKAGNVLNKGSFATGAATAVFSPNPISKIVGGTKVMTSLNSENKTRQKLADISDNRDKLRQQATDRYNKASELKPNLEELENEKKAKDNDMQRM